MLQDQQHGRQNDRPCADEVVPDRLEHQAYVEHRSPNVEHLHLINDARHYQHSRHDCQDGHGIRGCHGPVLGSSSMHPAHGYPGINADEDRDGRASPLKKSKFLRIRHHATSPGAFTPNFLAYRHMIISCRAIRLGPRTFAHQGGWGMSVRHVTRVSLPAPRQRTHTNAGKLAPVWLLTQRCSATPREATLSRSKQTLQMSDPTDLNLREKRRSGRPC